MNKYENSKIYKIINDDYPGLTYYGSTYNSLAKRVSVHRSPLNECSTKMFQASGKMEIFLIESYPCNNIDELRARERYYIENNECINKCIPGRTKKEYDKAYRDNNQEKIKAYRDNNQEKIKAYRIDNKEKLKELNKSYYEDRNEKMTCECGTVHSLRNKARHFKSVKHQAFLSK